MNYKALSLCLALCFPLVITGCNQHRSGGSGAAVGTVAGAVVGGVIGNQFGKGSGRTAATIAGAAIGGLIGNQVGQNLDDNNKRLYYRTMQRAHYAPTGYTLSWGRPGYNNTYGYITPVTSNYVYRGKVCRTTRDEVYINGNKYVNKSRSCRQQTGSWRRARY